MSVGNYGSTLDRRQYAPALEINNMVYEITFNNRRMALAEKNISRARTLAQTLTRIEELGVRLKWKMNLNNDKGGNA